MNGSRRCDLSPRSETCLLFLKQNQIGTNPTRKVKKASSHGRAMAQAYRIDFSKIVRARAARRADSAASFYRACKNRHESDTQGQKRQQPWSSHGSGMSRGQRRKFLPRMQK